ncbi:hypothetical protein C2S53_019662 [Perilla frutescens var. hirtella]|uniref:Uncharacterized protein n=1 Tax=Perilla frutescens var. hirtella TaxID=608512 RepID=A0AAD4ITB1_PERFH|nr:hypothetical protein C2S53_019662 [Perilla frutescens var. hirtella]
MTELAPHHHSATAFRWTLRRRRRRLATVRLGGKKRGGGSFLGRVKLQWVRAKYFSMLKKLKKYYHSLVEEMHTAEEEGAEESFRPKKHLQTNYYATVGYSWV